MWFGRKLKNIDILFDNFIWDMVLLFIGRVSWEFLQMITAFDISVKEITSDYMEAQ